MLVPAPFVLNVPLAVRPVQFRDVQFAIMQDFMHRQLFVMLAQLDALHAQPQDVHFVIQQLDIILLPLLVLLAQQAVLLAAIIHQLHVQHAIQAIILVQELDHANKQHLQIQTAKYFKVVQLAVPVYLHMYFLLVHLNAQY